MTPRFAALLVLAIFAGPASAQVHKCVGRDGKVIYTEEPCAAGSTSSTVRPPSPPAVNKGKTPAELEADFRKRQLQGQEAQKKAAEESANAEQKEQNCRLSKQALTQAQSGGRMAALDDKGERYFMNDEQIAKERARAQSLVDQWCK